MAATVEIHAREYRYGVPLHCMFESIEGMNGERDALTYYARPLADAYYAISSLDDLVTKLRAVIPLQLARPTRAPTDAGRSGGASDGISRVSAAGSHFFLPFLFLPFLLFLPSFFDFFAIGITSPQSNVNDLLTTRQHIIDRADLG